MNRHDAAHLCYLRKFPQRHGVSRDRINLNPDQMRYDAQATGIMAAHVHLIARRRNI